MSEGTTQNRRKGDEDTDNESLIAGILSLVIPGAGQMYLGDTKRGAIFLGVDVLLFILGTLLAIVLIGFLFFFMMPIVHAVAAYDAYKMSEEGEGLF